MWSLARTILKASWARLRRPEQIVRIFRARLPLTWLMQPGYREKPTKQTVYESCPYRAEALRAVLSADLFSTVHLAIYNHINKAMPFLLNWN